MSNEDGSNKRVVKKTNKNIQKMNIKVSTEDKDEIPRNNKDSRNKTYKLKNSYTTQDKNEDIFQITKNLQHELNSLKLEINESAENDFKEIDSLNNEITELGNQYNELTNENYELIARLKNIENEVSGKFISKFKISKILSREKELAEQNNIKAQIKSKDGQIKIMKKNIQKNENRINEIQNLLEKYGNINVEKLNKDLMNIKKKIEEKEKNINDLLEIEKQHELCKKELSDLNIQYNILLNDVNFEKKMRDAMVKEEKEEKERKENYAPREKIFHNEGEKYAEQVRQKFFSKIKEEDKYKAKINLVKYNLFNNLSKEFDQQIESNQNTSRQLQTENNKIKETNYNVDYSHTSLPSLINSQVFSKIDCKSPKSYLFTEKEKEIFNKLIPEKYANITKEKYNNIEIQINEIEGNMKKEKKEYKKVMNNNKLQIDITNLKIKEESIKIKQKNEEILKNRRKILDKNKEIRDINNKIKKEIEKKEKAKKNNKALLKIISELKKQKEEERKKQEEEEEEEA